MNGKRMENRIGEINLPFKLILKREILIGWKSRLLLWYAVKVKATSIILIDTNIGIRDNGFEISG